MRLYLIRHGETDYNRQKRNQGRIDVPLNEYGRKLAVCTRTGLAGVPFDLCFCSPLGRARETAELILEGRKVPIFTDERITEVSFGSYEGRCWDSEAWDEEMPREFRYFFDDPGKYQAPSDGETLEELKRRTGEFLDDICGRKEYAGSTILVSTHGAALAGMLANIRGLPVSGFWGRGCNSNCGVTVVSFEQGVFSILEENVIYY